MNNEINGGFLPINKKEADALGYGVPDFVYVCGDAYVDHPSFGAAIISRVLQSAGYTVAMLPQPDERGAEAFSFWDRFLKEIYKTVTNADVKRGMI